MIPTKPRRAIRALKRVYNAQISFETAQRRAVEYLVNAPVEIWGNTVTATVDTSTQKYVNDFFNNNLSNIVNPTEDVQTEDGFITAINSKITELQRSSFVTRTSANTTNTRNSKRKIAILRYALEQYTQKYRKIQLDKIQTAQCNPGEGKSNIAQSIPSAAVSPAAPSSIPPTKTSDELKTEFQSIIKDETERQIKEILIETANTIEKNVLFKSIINRVHLPFFVVLKSYKNLNKFDNSEFDDMRNADKEYVRNIIKVVIPQIDLNLLYDLAPAGVNNSSNLLIRSFFDYLISKRSTQPLDTISQIKREFESLIAELFTFDTTSDTVDQSEIDTYHRTLRNFEADTKFQLMLTSTDIISCLSNIAKLGPVPAGDIDKINRSTAICQLASKALTEITDTKNTFVFSEFDKASAETIVNGKSIFPAKADGDSKRAIDVAKTEIDAAVAEANAVATADAAADEATAAVKQALKGVLAMIPTSDTNILNVLLNMNKTQYVEGNNIQNVKINDDNSGYAYQEMYGRQLNNKEVKFSVDAPSATAAPPSLDDLLIILENENNVKIFCLAINFAFSKIITRADNAVFDKIVNDFLKNKSSPKITYNTIRGGSKRQTLKQHKKTAKHHSPIRRKTSRMNKRRSMKR